MEYLGKFLFAAGLAAAVLGLFLWMAPSIPLIGRLGHLPGDIYIRRSNFSFYFPLTTTIIISVIASLILAWMRR